MNLLGTPFLLLAVVVSAVVLVAVAALWDRWPGICAWPLRLLSLLLVMAVGAGLVGTVVDRELGFYATTGELFGQATVLVPAPVSAPVVAADDVVLDPGWRAAGLSAAQRGRGTVVSVVLAGPLSRISRTGLVYLPAVWFLAHHPALPVVELLHGYPGIPQNLRDQLHVGDVLDREIAAHRMPPVVAVAPKTYDGRASECVDAGPRRKDETYLVGDVPHVLHRLFGTRSGRSLGLVGYSEGGFCAVDLALHHPETVAAAVSLSGYFVAGTDPHTPDLYRGHPGLLQHDSPLSWVRRCAPTGPPLLVVASRGDSEAVRDDDALRRAAARDPLLRLTAAELPSGGHNFGTFSAALAPSLDYLGRHLPAVLSAPLLLPPARPLGAFPGPGPTARPRTGPVGHRAGPGARTSPAAREQVPPAGVPSWCAPGFPSSPLPPLSGSPAPAPRGSAPNAGRAGRPHSASSGRRSATGRAPRGVQGTSRSGGRGSGPA